jgi:tryptophan synthase alpha subunit
VNKDLIGWKPVWNREKFLQSMDEEINDFLELGMPESSLLASLGPQTKR